MLARETGSSSTSEEPDHESAQEPDPPTQPNSEHNGGIGFETDPALDQSEPSRSGSESGNPPEPPGVQDTETGIQKGTDSPAATAEAEEQGDYGLGVKLTREGIEISERLAADKLPPGVFDPDQELPYQFPNPSRRRLAALIYAIAGAFLLIWVPSRPQLLIGVAILGIIAAWSWLAAWPLNIDQYQALAIAAQQVDFVVGPVTAAVTFHGWRSRPHWNVILYSSDQSHSQRALVQIDAVSADILEDTYVETTPLPPG